MSRVGNVFMSIIACAFVGALGAGILAVCVFVVAEVFLPHFVRQGWVEVGLFLLGLYGTCVGCALGGIYGAVRTLPGLESRAVPIFLSVLYVTVYLVIALCEVFNS